MLVVFQQDLILCILLLFFCWLYLITLSINLLRKDVKLIAFNFPGFSLLKLRVTLVTFQSLGAKFDLRHKFFFFLKKSGNLSSLGTLGSMLVEFEDFLWFFSRCSGKFSFLTSSSNSFLKKVNTDPGISP